MSDIIQNDIEKENDGVSIGEDVRGDLVTYEAHSIVDSDNDWAADEAITLYSDDCDDVSSLSSQGC